MLFLGAAAAFAQAATKDQPPASADLFQPLPVAFDLTPEQQQAMQAYRSDPSAGEIQLFRVNLSVPKTADAVNFNIVPGVAMMLSTRNRNDRSTADYSWTGGDATGEKSAALVVKDQQVTGTVRNGDKLYRLRPVGNGVTAVIEIDQKKLPPEHPPAFDQKKHPPKEPSLQSSLTARPASTSKRAATRAVVASRADAPGSGGASTGSGGGAAGSADACGTIDVLVAYTPAAEQQSGAIDALVQLAIDETNNSYANSGIRPRLRLAHQARTSYVESGDMEVDVARLANPSDGFLDDVPPLRDLHQADIAVLITGNGNFCGIAADILATADNAFAVVGQNCATGYYSFGHEVGHLQGARHNPEADPTATPFAFGHGFFSPANRKRTVMSYDCPMGCTRIDVWADPTIMVLGVAMGSAALNHDARVINETACAVAGFRQATGVAPVSGPSGGTGTSTAGTGSGSGASTPHSAPAFSTWSLLALVALAPLLVRGRERA
jgi:hypothetical protein